MDSLHGHVTGVALEVRGDEVADAVAISDDQCLVHDAADFDELGGQFVVAGDSATIYTYTGFVEQDGGDLIVGISPTFAATVDVDTRIDVWNPATSDVVSEWFATVADDLDGSAIVAAIDHALIDRLGEDVRGLLGESVVCTSDDVDEWTVTDLLGKSPVVDGSFMDPATIPEAEPPEPPTDSPVLTAYGMPDTILLRTEPIASTTWLTYEVSSDDGATWDPLPGMPVRSTLVVAKEAPGSVPFVVGHPYLVRVVAGNAAGNAAPSAEVPVTLDVSAIEVVAAQVITDSVIAGFLLAGRIEIGGDTFTLTPPGVDPEDPSGGLRIELADGGLIHLPADGSEATITAHLVAQSLNVENGASINGDSLLTGEIRIGAVVENPSDAPTVSFGYPLVKAVGKGASAGVSLAGLMRNVADDAWIVMGHETGTDNGRAWLVPDVGTVTSVIDDFNGKIVASTKLGSHYYFITQTDNGTATPVWDLWKFDSALDYVDSYSGLYGDGVRTNTGYWPAIGSDGTNLKIAYHSSFGNLVVATYSPTTLAIIGSPTALDTADGSPGHVSGYHEGSADFGATRKVVVHHTQDARVYSAADTRVGAAEWTRRSNNIRGLWWDGTNFFMLTSTGSIYRLNDDRVLNSTLDAAYAWQTDDGAYTTDGSPVISATWPARTYPTITAAPAPQVGSAEANAADSVAIFANTTGTRYRQGSILAVGTRAKTIDPLVTSGTAEPTANNFSAVSTPGSITSSVSDGNGPMIQLEGSGDARIGDIQVESDGDVTWLGAPDDLSLTASTGWTIQKAQAHRFGPFVEVLIHCTRTGADMAIGSGGNLSPDVEVCTGIPTSLRPGVAEPGTIWRVGVQSGVARIGTDGSVAVTDGSPSMTLPGSGTAYVIKVLYALGMVAP